MNGVSARHIAVPDELARHLSLQDAVTDDLDQGPDLLPPQLPSTLIRGHEKELADYISDRLHAGFPLGDPEIVLVKKAKRGIRPVPVLSLEERAVYGSLVSVLSTALPVNGRLLDYEAFKSGPLQSSETEFVVMSDVSSYYQYVDHGLLRQQIIDQCGEAILADSICSFLEGISGRTFGLPQSHRPSGPLGELLIDVVERRLLRRGWAIWRYTDDFRIAAPSAQEAGVALQELYEELRPLGLTLNEEKTRILTRTQYEAWVTRPEQEWESLEGDAAERLRDYDPYADRVLEPEEADVTVTAAEAFLEEWSTRREQEVLAYGYEATAIRQMLTRCFIVCEAYKAPNAVAYSAGVLEDEPSLTPRIARYLKVVTAANAPAVSGVIDTLLNATDLHISPWQALWFCEVMGGYSPFSDAQDRWLRAQTGDDRPGCAAASAAYLMARSGEITVESLGVLYGKVPAASRLVIAAAMAVVDPKRESPIVKATAAENPINALVMPVGSAPEEIDLDDIPF